MLTNERREETLCLLRLRGELSYEWLAAHFGVSEMTARRDVEALEAAGEARRVRGGAISVVSRAHEPAVVEREQLERDAKESIAAAAAELVRSGDSLYLDSGTSAIVLASHLARLGARLLVVTPNLRAATVLAESPEIRVVLTGGTLRPAEQSLVGAEAERTVGTYNVDTAFLGAAGVHLERGVTDYGVDEASVKRLAVSRAQRVVVLADRTKLGRVSLCEICPTSEIDVLVTDAPAQAPEVTALRGAGTEVLLVPQD